MRKKKLKLKLSYWLTLIAGVTLAYFIWLTWDKLTELIGNSNIVWAITGGLVIIFMLTGYFSFKKIAERFT